MKVKSLEVSLFKGFQKSKLQFNEGLNLLVGANNSGKSSLLQAIYLAFHFLSVTNGISEKDKKSKNKLKGVMLKSFPLPLHDEASISEGLKKRSRRGEKSTYFKIGLFNGINFMEGLTFPGGSPLIISSNCDGSEGNKTYRSNILKKVVKKRQPLLIPIFAGVASIEEIKTKEVVNYYVATGKSSEVLRNQLKEMSKKKLSLLNRYLKDSFNVEILSSEKTSEIYLSSIYKEGKYNNLDISLAGSGFQQILQILVYIVSSDSDIILIDEPDAHLHYKLQKILYSILTKLAEDGKQIIVATHSQVFIKNALEKNDHLILVNKKIENQKSINDYEDHVKELYEDGLLDEEEITEKKEIKYIFLEDGDRGNGFKIIKKFLDLLGYQDPGLKIISSHGEMDTDIKYLERSRDIDGRKFKALIIKDSDSMPQEYLDKLKEKYKDKDISLCFLDVNEAENYLINVKLIIQAIKQKNKELEIDDSKIEDMINSEIQKEKDNLIGNILDRSLQGKLMEYCGDIDLIPNNIQSKTREIRNDICKNDFKFPYSKLPGKEMFKIIKSKIHKEYKVSLSEIDVTSAFRCADVPKILKDALEFLK